MASLNVLRSHVFHDIIGSPKELSILKLPTVEDVLRHYLWERNKKMRELESRKEPSAKEISYVVGRKVVDIWTIASFGDKAIVSERRIVAMISKYLEQVRKLQKSSKKDSSFSNGQIASFQRSAKNNLFDIAACKCIDPVLQCSCKNENKVPKLELPFLLDQRSERKMVVEKIDHKETNRLHKRHKRDTKREERESKNKETSQRDIIVPDLSEPEDEEHVVNNQRETDSDTDFQPSRKVQRSVYVPVTQQRLKLPNFSSAVFRTQTSKRDAALLASSLLEDIGVVTPENKEKVIDPNKIQRGKQSLSKHILKETSTTLQQKKLKAIYFDGRIDSTLVIERKQDDTYYRTTQKEEHIVLVEEPESRYLGHVTPSAGTGESISKAMLSFIREHKMDLSDIAVIGSDGTVTNTGHTNGVMSLIEKAIQKPLQRIICILHTNELPLRHLFETLDGRTTGPETYQGPIGKLLSNCETMPVAKFSPVSVRWIQDLKLEQVQDLSSDQQYFLEICKAVSSGRCPQRLTELNPGKLHHARWLTAASRILRVYLATSTPTESLVTIVAYIMKVYALVWFSVKCKPSISDGARHLWKMISFSRFLDEKARMVIDPVIRRNAWFSHPENLLLSFITDVHPNIRQLGWRRILKARTNSTMKSPRRFCVPQNLKLDASSYTDMIDWSECILTEPPVTKHLSKEEIKHNIQMSAFPEETSNIMCYPSHTQSVERMVKLVTEAASFVCGSDARHGFVLATLKSRKKMPQFISKSSYVTSPE